MEMDAVQNQRAIWKKKKKEKSQPSPTSTHQASPAMPVVCFIYCWITEIDKCCVFFFISIFFVIL